MKSNCNVERNPIWDRHISRENKKSTCNSIIKNIKTYGSEVWSNKDKTENIVTATEMDFWRRAAGRSRRDTRDNASIERTVIENIWTKQFIWYGHVRWMNKERILRRVMEWMPVGKQRSGR